MTPPPNRRPAQPCSDDTARCLAQPRSRFTHTGSAPQPHVLHAARARRDCSPGPHTSHPASFPS